MYTLNKSAPKRGLPSGFIANTIKHNYFKEAKRKNEFDPAEIIIHV